LKVPKIRKIAVPKGTVIVPIGDPNWKLLPGSLRMGYEAYVTGSDAAVFQVKRVELLREIGGRRVDYFVAQTGSDAADGSAKAPWRSVQKGVTAVPSGWADEPTVLHIGVGSFAESFDGKNGQLRILDKKNMVREWKVAPRFILAITLKPRKLT
jgi:hypothetical protein